MKIKRDKFDNKLYIHFTKKCFLTFLNDWEQISGKWNWIEFNIIQLYFENDTWTGGYEFVFQLLGLGFRIRYNYDLEKLDRIIDEDNIRNNK
jgi:hypothetical protein